MLRALEPGDIDLLMQWENDPDNWEISGTIAPYSRATLESFIKQSDLSVFQTGQMRLMIDLLSDKRTIGTIDLFEFDPFHRRAGVGILIGGEHRGKGYGKESLSLLINYVFDHLGLHQLYCNVLSDNQMSLKLFESAGFDITGERKQWIRVNEDYKGQYFMQLFK